MSFQGSFEGCQRATCFKGGSQGIPHLGGSVVEGEFTHICLMGLCYQIVVCAPSGVVAVGVANFLEMFGQICGY